MAGTRVVLLVLGTVASVLIARALGPAGRGQYALVVTVVATVVALSHSSIEQAQVYLTSTGELRRRLAANAVLIAVVAALVGIAVVVAASAGAGYPFSDLGDPVVLLALATVPVLLLGLYLNGLLVLADRTDVLNRGALLGGTAQCAVLIALAATGRLSVGTVVLAWALAAVLPSAVAVGTLRPRVRDVSLALVRKELAVGLRYHGGLASLYLLLRVDVLLLAAMTDDATVGLYALAVSLVELTNVATDSVATVVVRRQTVSRLEDAARLTARVTGVTLVLAAACAGGVAAVSPVLVPAVFGQDFDAAVPALLALVPGVVALAASRSAGGYLVRLNRPWVVSGMATSALALNVALNLLLIPRWGAVGAGVATSVAYALLAGCYVTWLCRAGRLTAGHFRPRLPWGTLLRRS